MEDDIADIGDVDHHTTVLRSPSGYGAGLWPLYRWFDPTPQDQ